VGLALVKQPLEVPLFAHPSTHFIHMWKGKRPRALGTSNNYDKWFETPYERVTKAKNCTTIH